MSDTPSPEANQETTETRESVSVEKDVSKAMLEMFGDAETAANVEAAIKDVSTNNTYDPNSFTCYNYADALAAKVKNKGIISLDNFQIGIYANHPIDANGDKRLEYSHAMVIIKRNADSKCLLIEPQSGNRNAPSERAKKVVLYGVSEDSLSDAYMIHLKSTPVYKDALEFLERPDTSSDTMIVYVS